MATTSVQRFYVNRTVVPMEEDHTHEFKGHRNITQADVPPFAKVKGAVSRAPISKALNAFLNTGNGGTVYMGIGDDGMVEGLHLTQYMKDHVIMSLKNVLDSYTPCVESHRYTVSFIPIVENKSTHEEIEEILSFDSTKTVNLEERRRPHVFRNHRYCWCDKDSIARFNNGSVEPLYVIEVQIRAWDNSDPRNEKMCVGKINLHPIHMDEDDHVYVRRQGSMMQCTPQDVRNMSRQMVSRYYQPRIKELQMKIQEAKERAKAKSSD